MLGLNTLILFAILHKSEAKRWCRKKVLAVLKYRLVPLALECFCHKASNLAFLSSFSQSELFPFRAKEVEEL